MDPINLAVHIFDMIFAIDDDKTWRPQPLDPKYEAFALRHVMYQFNEDGKLI